ncbi:TPA: hypothetical protein MIV75_17590 [Klebsiella pneumoniae]|nr:hypothetical protein [Klebsiella pneumoniae]HBY5060245.1 hypothetical protein [Klebsiella pneumoniae]
MKEKIIKSKILISIIEKFQDILKNLAISIILIIKIELAKHILLECKIFFIFNPKVIVDYNLFS